MSCIDVNMTGSFQVLYSKLFGREHHNVWFTDSFQVSGLLFLNVKRNPEITINLNMRILVTECLQHGLLSPSYSYIGKIKATSSQKHNCPHRQTSC
jgi:hypothetical protein